MSQSGSPEWRIPERSGLRPLRHVSLDEYGAYLAGFGALERRAPEDLAELLLAVGSDPVRLVAIALAVFDATATGSESVVRTPSELREAAALLVG